MPVIKGNCALLKKKRQIRMVLRGDSLAPVAEIFENVSSVHHGHVQAVHGAMSQVVSGQMYWWA